MHTRFLRYILAFFVGTICLQQYVFSMEPVEDSIEKSSGTPSISAGAYAVNGGRSQMEDRWVISSRSDDNSIDQFHIFDGHGGEEVAQWLSEKVPKLIEQYIKDEKSIEDCVKDAFRDLDQDLQKKNIECYKTGSTAVSALIYEGDLLVANIGDSEALLITSNSWKLMTIRHRAEDQKEKERVESLGAEVKNNRLQGKLAVTRAFGDSYFKIPHRRDNFVTAEPHIKIVSINPNYRYLILGSDGLWDMLPKEKVAEFVQLGANKGHAPEKIAKKLVIKALKQSYKGNVQDNIAVIVIQFHHCSDDGRLNKKNQKGCTIS